MGRCGASSLKEKDEDEIPSARSRRVRRESKEVVALERVCMDDVEVDEGGC